MGTADGALPTLYTDTLRAFVAPCHIVIFRIRKREMKGSLSPADLPAEGS